jgi:FAD/FMN-containing dehydrogenase
VNPTNGERRIVSTGTGPALVEALAHVVGDEHVLVDADLRAGYEIDWTRRFSGPCQAVVRPGTTAEVAAVLAWCSSAGVTVVPQGGNTGLVGGGVPPPDGAAVVLSTRRLSTIGEIDEVAGQITFGAGVTLAAAEASTIASDWRVGVDLGARESATIGGMAATNAGGTQVLRYGMMRHNVAGIEAVLADGTVIEHLRGLIKDNTGYDLASLLCGSEGTLAVITAVRMQLVRAEGERTVAWVGCDSWTDAVALATIVRGAVPDVVGIEAVDAASQAVVGERLGLRQPLPSAVAVLVAATGGGVEALAGAVGDRPVAVAADASRAADLWARRDRVTEAIAHVGIPHKLDVSVPLRAIGAFTDALPAVVAGAFPSGSVFVFGHLGDGNLHVNVVGPAPSDESVDDAVLRLVVAHGGSISAEHGIGRAKRRWLDLGRSPAELATFAAIKHALDPAGILNPGCGPVP